MWRETIHLEMYRPKRKKEKDWRGLKDMTGLPEIS